MQNNVLEQSTCHSNIGSSTSTSLDQIASTTNTLLAVLKYTSNYVHEYLNLALMPNGYVYIWDYVMMIIIQCNRNRLHQEIL